MRFVIHELRHAEHAAWLVQRSLEYPDASAAAVFRRHIGDAIHMQLDEVKNLLFDSG